jgi:type VI secretion system protein
MQIRKERLFERIRRVEDAPDRVIESNAELLKRSVVNHLRHILNTRQGSVEIADDYGIPDFTNIINETDLRSIEDVQETVREVILKYEPRLADVRVTHHKEKKDTTIGITFRLNGSIRYRDKEIPVVFETVLEPNGQISISG